MKAKNRTEAWRIADALFPGDYELDQTRSKNAGYNVYYSTREGINAWISDLNTRLEINYHNGSSENIWIEEESAPVSMKASVRSIKGEFEEYVLTNIVSVNMVCGTLILIASVNGEVNTHMYKSEDVIIDIH